MTLMDRRHMMLRAAQAEDVGWTSGVPYDIAWQTNPSASYLLESDLLPAAGLQHVLRGGTATGAFNKVVCYGKNGTSIGNATSVHPAFPGYFCLIKGTTAIQVELNTRYDTKANNTLVIPTVLPTVPAGNAALNTLYTAPITSGISIWNNTGAETEKSGYVTTDYVYCQGLSTCRYRGNARSHIHFYTASKKSLNTGIIFQNTDTFSIPEGAVYFRRSATSWEYPFSIYQLRRQPMYGRLDDGVFIWLRK